MIYTVTKISRYIRLDSTMPACCLWRQIEAVSPICDVCFGVCELQFFGDTRWNLIPDGKETLIFVQLLARRICAMIGAGTGGH